jgi:hypothetical protein
MLSNITLSNKTTIDPSIVKAPPEDVILPDGTKYTPIDFNNVPSTNPIMFSRLNARDNPTTTENTLIINIDGKNYLASELSAVFNPGREPVTFNVKDLIQLDSVVKETSLYDVVLKNSNDNTLEIQGGRDDIYKYVNLSFDKAKTEEEIKQLELEYKEKNKCIGLQGFDITGVKINNTNVCCSSLELFTDKNMLKARAVFSLSNIKFSGEKVTTEATYYKEKEPNLVKYVFKPNEDLTTDYSDLVFYIDTNVETQNNINKKLDEAVNNNWKLYSIDDVVVDN